MLLQEAKAPTCSGRTLQELKQDNPSQVLRLRVDVIEQDYNNDLQLVARKKKYLRYRYSTQEMKLLGSLLHTTSEIMIEVNKANFSLSC